MGVSNVPVQQWQTVNRKMWTITERHGNALERTVAAEFLRPVTALIKSDRRILLLQRMVASAGGRKEKADIVVAVNIALSAKTVPRHVWLQRMTYKEGNLSGLLTTTAISSIQLPTMRETIL